MLATPTIRELARAQRTAPLGVRFWDPVLEHHVHDGLLVTSASVDLASLPRIALPNRTGGFGFRTLPGLRDSEIGASDSSFWASRPVHREYLIRMTDTQERFLPVTFRAMAPHPGWFTPPCAAQLQLHALPVGSIPLFSAPSRSLGPDTTAVRADLWDPIADRPAAWAFVRIQVSSEAGTATTLALSDHDGRVLAAFPHAEPLLQGQTRSPRTEPGGPPSLTWNITVAVFYRRLPGGRTSPELCDILGQPQASPIDPPSTEIVRDTRDPAFGSDLHLRSSSDSLGRVLVRPA